METKTLAIIGGLTALALWLPVFKNPMYNNRPTSLANFIKEVATGKRKHISTGQAIANAKARRILR